MPSLSFTSLDRLIEPASSSPTTQAGPSCDRITPFSFYPPLYATPPPQRPPSPTAFSPSPYVLNFKRRGPVQQHQNGGKESHVEASIDSSLEQQCQRMDGAQGKDMFGVPSEQKRLAKIAEIPLREYGVPGKAHEACTENEVFEMELEKRDASIGFANRNGHLCKGSSVNRHHGTGDALTAPSSSRSLVANEEVEFFDAPDSVFFDSASEDEGCSINVKPGRCLEEGWSGRTAARMEEEIARRMKAEENVTIWQRRWNEMAKRCAKMGVSLSFEAENVLGNDGDSAEVLKQELLVARLVGGAMARAVVRAEKDEELERMLGIKNREISRLWDKLQYLELVNREMSQRNQEVTELTQRRKKRRQRRRKLAFSGFCAAVCIGTAGLVCYKCVPWDHALWTNLFHKSPAIEADST